MQFLPLENKSQKLRKSKPVSATNYLQLINWTHGTVKQNAQL